MKKKLLLPSLLIIAMALLLAACGGDDAAEDTDSSTEAETETTETEETEDSGELTTVELGMLPLTSSAPLFIGIEHGFFEDEGIELDVQWFDAAQPIAVATTSGDIDVGATGITASLYNMVAGGEELLIVADKGREQEGYSSTALMVHSDSDIESIADLEGKQIGITQTGSTYHYMAGRLLEENGLSTDDVELVPLNSIPGLMETLQSQQVDAVLLNEPNVSRVIDEGYGKVIEQVGDVIDYQTSGIFFSSSFAEDEETAKNFMKAYVKSVRYYYDAVLVKEDGEIVPGENFDEVISITAEYTDQEPALIERGVPYMDRDGVLLAEDIQTQIDWYAKENLIDGTIDSADIVNTEILEEALSELE